MKALHDASIIALDNFGPKAPLAQIGLLLHLFSRSEYQRRIERFIQTKVQRVVATLSSCSFVLPPDYHLYCDIACAYSFIFCQIVVSNPVRRLSLQQVAKLFRIISIL